MKLSLRLRAAAALLLALASSTAMPAHADVPDSHAPAIIPLPQSIQSSGGDFVMPASSTYAVPAGNDSVAAMMARVAPGLAEAAGVTLTPAAAGSSATITLKADPAQGPEAYTLSVTPEGITATASRAAGFFYAMQTLRQLLPARSDAPATLPLVEIADEPRFGWRGFMLDEGRHMFGKDEVKRVLDMMALYKMNRFHWHLTEDQGWRIEIKKYPLLTEVGAKRPSRSLAWWGHTEPDTVGYDGYYTQDDVREIVAYAADRFIDVVPEIDIPGHTQAAVASYPELLACDPENPHEVWLWQGVSPDVMNVANPAAVKMSKDIIDELVELFPFPYIHLGGDECPTDKWEALPEAKALLDSMGSDNYRDLQLNFYRELAAHMASKPASKQRRMIFWNEVLHGNTAMLPSDVVIMAWVGADKAAEEAAGRGLQTILTPQIPYYINRKQSTLATEPYTQGRGTETLEAVYAYEPMRGVDPALHNKYMGVQANFWSEWVITPELLEYLMLPRLAAVAEAGWTPQQQREYDDFRRRVRAQQPLYRANGWNYAPHEFVNEPCSKCAAETPAAH